MQDLLLTIQNKEELDELFSLAYEFLTSPKRNNPEPKKLKTTQDDLEFSIRQLASAIRLYSLRDLSEEELMSRFLHLPAELQRMAICIIKGRREEVITAQVEDVNCRTTPLMLSFDWNIRWVLGSSSLSNHKAQIVQLELLCRHPKGEVKPLLIEMNKNDVDKMIELLEKKSG